MKALLKEIIRLRIPLIVGFLLCSLLLCSAVIAATIIPVDYGMLFRDVGAHNDLPISQGFYSQLGLMIWGLAAGALLLSAIAAWSPTQSGDSGKTKWFFPYGFGLTLLLAFDDGFRIHETLFGELFGLHEMVAYGLYGIACLTYLLVFRRQVFFNSPYPVLGVAFALLAASMTVDMIPALANYVGKQGIFLLEDGAKLSGIVFWLLYHLLAGRQALVADISRDKEADHKAKAAASPAPPVRRASVAGTAPYRRAPGQVAAFSQGQQR